MKRTNKTEACFQKTTDLTLPPIYSTKGFISWTMEYVNFVVSESYSLFALLGLELPDVKLELFSLENISVGATDLAGS